MIMQYIIKVNELPDMQNLARWLIAHERREINTNTSEVIAQTAVCVCVCEKLRKPLSTLAGVAGYKALISRALALAKVDVPSLAVLEVKDDGSLAVLNVYDPERDLDEVQNGDTALTAQLIGLLVTFIGEALTMQLVRDVWPDAPFNSIDSEMEKL